VEMIDAADYARSRPKPVLDTESGRVHALDAAVTYYVFVSSFNRAVMATAARTNGRDGVLYSTTKPSATLWCGDWMAAAVAGRSSGEVLRDP